MKLTLGFQLQQCSRVFELANEMYNLEDVGMVCTHADAPARAYALQQVTRST